MSNKWSNICAVGTLDEVFAASLRTRKLLSSSKGQGVANARVRFQGILGIQYFHAHHLSVSRGSTIIFVR